MIINELVIANGHCTVVSADLLICTCNAHRCPFHISRWPWSWHISSM